MDERGLPLRPQAVRRMALIIATDRVGSRTRTPPTIGSKWVDRFVSRHPQLKSKWSRKYDHQRAKCEDPEIIGNWFRLVRNMVAKHGILDEDIYNFDETGFQMGVLATAKVITRAERVGRPVIKQPGNREWVTAVEAISATGWVLPPMIILMGVMHQASWYRDGLIPPDWTIAVSKNGWTDDNLGLQWLKEVFDKHTKSRTRGVRRLLILDGHGSHATPEFDKYCSDNSIIPLCMPAHSLYLLQPLDVGCFAPLKRIYGKSVEDKIRLGINHTDKVEFLHSYQKARTVAINPLTVINSFAATGLVPFDPDRVLSRLQIVHTPSPQLPPEPTATTWVPETPHNLHDLGCQAETVKKLLGGRITSSTSPTQLALAQLFKGCEMAMQNALLLTDENKQLRMANERQTKKRSSRRSYVARGGVLTGEEGLNQVQLAAEANPAVVVEAERPSKTRAPSRCSYCGSLKHTARTCTDY